MRVLDRLKRLKSTENRKKFLDEFLKYEGNIGREEIITIMDAAEPPKAKSVMHKKVTQRSAERTKSSNFAIAEKYPN